MLRIIERVTKQRIEPMTLPSVADVNEQRRRASSRSGSPKRVQSGGGQVFQAAAASSWSRSRTCRRSRSRRRWRDCFRAKRRSCSRSGRMTRERFRDARPDQRCQRGGPRGGNDRRGNIASTAARQIVQRARVAGFVPRQTGPARRVADFDWSEGPAHEDRGFQA